MSGAADAESVRIAAVPERVRLARAFVAAVLGESHPCKDLAVLLASELVTNGVRHSGSAFPAPVSTAYQPAGSATQPSPPHGVSGTGPAGAAPVTTYTYDTAGHVTGITAPGSTQSLSWND